MMDQAFKIYRHADGSHTVPTFPHTYRMAIAPKDIWESAAWKIIHAIGLKQGQELPIRPVLHAVGIEAGPDADCVYMPMRRAFLFFWRA